MASCVRNIRTKNCHNLVIGFQITVENVGDAFLGHSVDYHSENSRRPCTSVQLLPDQLLVQSFLHGEGLVDFLLVQMRY